MSVTIALLNQKGGVGKSTSTTNLAAGLVRHGKRVLCVDLDAQASLTQMLGWQEPAITLSDMLAKVIDEEPLDRDEGILRHREGIRLMPSGIELAGMELSLVNVMSRETILRQYLSVVKKDYDVVLLDCAPSLGMLTINAMAAADRIIIPVVPHYLPVKGMEQLLKNIAKVRKHFNKKLSIEGILLTMVEERTTLAKSIMQLVRDTYGDSIRVFDARIPHSIKGAEMAAAGVSIFEYDPRGKVAAAYESLTLELLSIERERMQKPRTHGRDR